MQGRLKLRYWKETRKGIIMMADSYQTDNLICYCFEYTKNDIEQDLTKNGRSLIMEKIAAEKKAGGCDCATKNPKGR